MSLEKTCCTCKTIKSIADFNVRRAARDGLQDRCRSCSAAWYQANKAAHMENVTKRKLKTREASRQRLLAYFGEHPCEDCGETDLRVLEFDHLEEFEKEAHVSELIAWGFSWERVLEEIAKCDVVCANCHKIRTYTRSGAWRHVEHERLAEEQKAFVEARLRRIFTGAG